MINSIESNLYFDYKTVKNLEEGILFGESIPSCCYHILISKKKGNICIVWHQEGMKCQFCEMETNEIAIFI